ncbi:MAG: 2-oxoglutarate dehydrogenase E1 component [Bacteroidota bacterium]
MDKYSYLSNTNIAFIEEEYKKYQNDPSSVDSGWARFFEGFEFAKKDYSSSEGDIPQNMHKEFKVIQLINAYRVRGHLFTRTNPVRDRRKYSPSLDIENFGLDNTDLETIFQAGTDCGIGPAKLKDIVEHLEICYCQSIGVEFMYIRKPEKIDWLKKRMHHNANLPDFNPSQKKEILNNLIKAVGFEQFLHSRFPGQKRFSLEGSESLIPALDALIIKCAEEGTEEIVMGMAHRGRLNVLANIFQKSYKEIFSEFEPKDYADASLDGDVKYHLGFTHERKVGKKKVSLTLSPNPSHLEAADPIVQGLARAKIDQEFQGDDLKVMPVLIHGDAAIAGQGVVYEVTQMADLPGYRTGGTIHIVINNQVGFTTNYSDGRSSTYCTDVGKVTLSPVFHVNGDDPEALVHVMNIAVEFRNRYKKDVFIDLLSYRKYGHNEGDEPKFTQPTLYKAIAKHPNPRDIYISQLIQEGSMSDEDAKGLQEAFKGLLAEDFDKSKKIKDADITAFLAKQWKGVKVAKAKDFNNSPATGVNLRKLKSLAGKLTEVPKDKKFFRKLERILKDRSEMVKNNKLDWGMAELLAYASILDENNNIRFSGQDCERGTFSHRHAVVKIEDSEEKYVHLQNLSKDQGEFYIYNSLLSEYGVMGFEYGYSLYTPHTLTIWEAQFGDFVNGAQIIIDQFLTSAEDKWRSMSGLVLLLPHGYEGMGPEHSSARIERFLTQCAEYNIQVANCTTPANFFHVLRRQLTRDFRKPLVIFTPKSLLRHPKCTCTMSDLSKGKFQEVIDDPLAKANDVSRVILCSGKIYYELLAKQEEEKAKDIAVVRVEQLYPLPQNQLDTIVAKYKNADDFVWVQEEPRNMGPAAYMTMNVDVPNFRVISRQASASPASGSPKRSENRQNEIINAAFSKVGKVVA